MKVIIFIGHHKVGTTSLQAFLAANAWKLRQHGILYPSLRGYGLLEAPRLAVRYLTQAVLGSTQLSTMNINTREPHNALAFKMLEEAQGNKVPFHKDVPPSDDIFSDISYQARDAQAETIILCGEVFSNFSLAKVNLINRLRDEFKRYEVQIMCTLRRVDQYLISWQGQRIKFGHRLEPLHRGALEMYQHGIHFNYKTLLKGWRDSFPEAKFVVRNYSDTLRSGGSVEDFLKFADLDFPGEMLRLPNKNPSLPLAFYELCRQINLKYPPEKARKYTQQIGALSRSENLHLAKDIEMLGEKTRMEMFEAFRPISRYLDQITDTPAFFSDLENMLEIKPESEFSAACSAKQLLIDSPDTEKSIKDLIEPLPLDACREHSQSMNSE